MRSCVEKAWRKELAIPAFNMFFLPVMAPVAAALRDTKTAGIIQVSLLELTDFDVKSLAEVSKEYEQVKTEGITWLHLDHVPLTDGNGGSVLYRRIIEEALDAGFQSVMIDGSRSPLERNIAVTREIVELAHASGACVEGEIGAILGYEEKLTQTYEEFFNSRMGFTDPGEAERFAHETGVDWISIAFGSIHGPVTEALRGQKKTEARLDLELLERISNRVQRPLVLHGGSGIRQADVKESLKKGIAKINIGTQVRQAYEQHRSESEQAGQDAVYQTVVSMLTNDLELAGSATRLEQA